LISSHSRLTPFCSVTETPQQQVVEEIAQINEGSDDYTCLHPQESLDGCVWPCLEKKPNFLLHSQSNVNGSLQPNSQGHLNGFFHYQKNLNGWLHPLGGESEWLMSSLGESE